MNTNFSLFLASLIVLLSLASAQASNGIFSTLTYNVAGLPELLSSAESDRQTATEQISCYVDVRENAKTSDGLELSDHPPVEARWTYNTSAQWQFSDRLGGPHGTGLTTTHYCPTVPLFVRSYFVREAVLIG